MMKDEKTLEEALAFIAGAKTQRERDSHTYIRCVRIVQSQKSKARASERKEKKAQENPENWRALICAELADLGMDMSILPKDKAKRIKREYLELIKKMLLKKNRIIGYPMKDIKAQFPEVTYRQLRHVLYRYGSGMGWELTQKRKPRAAKCKKPENE